MAAIASNGIGGGNWSTGASWTGLISPVAGDTVTIAAGDTITVDTTGLACKSVQLNGILTWLAATTTGITFGDATSDTIITFGAGGYWRAGTAATPLTGLHIVTFSPLCTSTATAVGHFSMASCNTVTSGVSIVCDPTVYGVSETYTQPTSGTAYATRRAFTQIATQINTAQANAVFSEDLKLQAGGGDIMVFPGSHATNNSVQNAPQSKTTSSYTAGTKTAVMTGNFATQVALNTLSGVATSGARCYTELSIFTITTTGTTKYWGFTGSSSANPLFDIQNCTLKRFSGNSNTFTQLDGKTILGSVLTGPVSQTCLGIRYNSTPMQYISCVMDAFSDQNSNPHYFYNCFVNIATQFIDCFNVMGTGTDLYDCMFQDAIQLVANTNGINFTRCGFLNCQSGGVSTGVSTDCWYVGCNLSGNNRNIRGIFGRGNTLVGDVFTTSTYDLCQFVGTIGTSYSGVSSRTAGMRYGLAAAMQTPSGANALSTIGAKLAPGGNTLGYSSPPDTIPVPPSGSTIYNKLTTNAAIAPSVAGQAFRPATHDYQFITVSGTTYSYTVPILAFSGYTASALTSIKLILTWANGVQVTTTISSLTAAVWNLTNVAGTAPVSGTATVSYYIQANAGGIYIDYPLDCDTAGFRWTNGVPQISQTRLADSIIPGTIASAVWADTTTYTAGKKGQVLQTRLGIGQFIALK